MLVSIGKWSGSGEWVGKTYGVGNTRRSSLAMFTMKNLRSGMAKQSPKKEHIKVNVTIFGKSFDGSSDKRPSWYMAGSPAVKRPPSPPAPAAVAWMIEFSLGPNGLPRIGTLGKTLVSSFTIP